MLEKTINIMFPIRCKPHGSDWEHYNSPRRCTVIFYYNLNKISRQAT